MELLLADILQGAVDRAGDRPAVSLRDRTLTFREVGDSAEHIAAVLAKKRVSRGQRIVWWGDLSVDAVPLFFGLARIGAVFIPINPSFTPSEAARVVDWTDPALLLTDDSRQGDLTLHEILSAPRPSVVDTEQVHETDPHVIYFTSGTTGSPKGVVLSQRTDILRSLQKLSNPWPLGPYLSMFPQFHMAGWTLPLSAWTVGDEVVHVERGDPDALLMAVERHRVHRTYFIPAVWKRVLDAEIGRYDTSSLSQADTGTSPTSPELIRRIREAFPETTTTINYGSTETGGVTQLWPQDLERKPGSVGRPNPGVHVRLGEHGEILVRSPFIMTEYFRDPEATAEAFADGWYHTGELAEVDEEGFYRIVGRIKDVIRTGGETVSPTELELVLQGHPGVRDIAVAGVPDEEWGEIVTAFVIPAPGARVTLADLRAYCAGKLTGYKHPRRMEVVETIPRTQTTGQVRRAHLVQMAVDCPLR